ncbi:hypothetical protein FRACA_170022 [Frankia canadensis]|uniref:Uncharacterized protein n=1 Tax=Frankia canadensis TaxID=1836972 RepID=A0A2I2KN45_9ACTN|nr:hypothetical protein [Frankia canadensis]SNQ47062.1 hypothetical protein FRACA_170022 [Frankia canadensis]SOU54352.1 hypothetical protein FRACA_170022 [Frankia canadensis]
MSGQLPGRVAVARRRALTVEARFAGLAQSGAGTAAIGAARDQMDRAFAELAAVEAATDAVSGGPDRDERYARYRFAVERYRALSRGNGPRTVPLVFARRTEVFVVVLGAFADLLAADGIPAGRLLAGISARAWADAVRATGDGHG